MINDIYVHKMKYDAKCRETQLPIETMEQFMYTYLNQKYGLKTLIIEWASTIISGVKTYLRDDHDITLFAKILKNECDEQFRFVQMHVKESLTGILKGIIRERNPIKSEKEIAKETETIANSYIEEWQWKKIIYKMYQQDDIETLNQRFYSMIADRNDKENNNPNVNLSLFVSKKTQEKRDLSQRKSKSRSRMTRQEELNHKKRNKPSMRLHFNFEFVKGILDFQLQEHERFLGEFNQLFKQVDQDHNGVINEEEFRELIMSMNVMVNNPNGSNREIETLLRVIDPFNNQQMTYSEVVQLLSNQLVPQQNFN